ncbi:hypothetical protein MPNT_190019 [Candidatus Methylacidithermus pantelleriae]|uniref:Uncharacterized protein n=1 Tax=Candidatus Methylacidithermus pantelleriae TaxID=2744239 RepID=A0A8J2BRY2_9BACT|nr:hypothetical protein MPNT_190019 [Candidatus Methylacidithermus pantelleriae]
MSISIRFFHRRWTTLIEGHTVRPLRLHMHDHHSCRQLFCSKKQTPILPRSPSRLAAKIVPLRPPTQLHFDMLRCATLPLRIFLALGNPSGEPGLGSATRFRWLAQHLLVWLLGDEPAVDSMVRRGTKDATKKGSSPAIFPGR